MKLYVGNISFSTTEDTLRSAFEAIGAVEDVFIAKDRQTGRSRGFAFVTMTNDNEAQTAIEQMNGSSLDGRTLTVNEARPRTDGGGGGGYRGGGGGGHRGGGSRW